MHGISTRGATDETMDPRSLWIFEDLFYFLFVIQQTFLFSCQKIDWDLFFLRLSAYPVGSQTLCSEKMRAEFTYYTFFDRGLQNRGLQNRGLRTGIFP